MKNTEEMLVREEQAWSAFVEAFAAVPVDRREEVGVVPGWSTKDLVWHSGYWVGYAAEVLERVAKGEAPLPDDDDFDVSNVAVNDEGRGLTWDEIISRCEGFRARARAALAALPELTDEQEGDFAGESYDHYDEHAAEIRAFASAKL